MTTAMSFAPELAESMGSRASDVRRDRLVCDALNNAQFDHPNADRQTLIAAAIEDLRAAISDLEVQA